MNQRFGLVCSAFLATFLTAVAASAADYNTDVKQTPLMSWSKTIASPSTSNLAPTAVAKQVDKLLAEDLASKDSGKAPKLGRRANDDVFLRRVYLDLAGRNPSPEEVTAFVLDPATDKRTKLVDRLLDDPRFGENWGRYWRDVIMYRRSDDRGQIAGPALAEYLTDAFNKNTHWDEIVRAFITAEGDVRENGATGLFMAQNGNTADITSEVSRIFLGIQIQCANCHDHKTDRWKREEFHQLAAFFPRIGVQQVNTDQKRTFEIKGNDVARGGRGEQVMRRNGSPEHLMPDLDHPDRPGTRMQPVFFLTGENVNYGSTDAVRRATIAVWITSPTNEWFAKALVNRIWAELVGEGFYDPIDDIGPDRDCSAPKTIDYLAHQFADSQFDIKRLYRIIAGTEAYQRESKSRRNPDGTPFAANCPQRLRGDQLYDALIAALGMREGPLAGRGGGGAQGRPLLRSPRNQFDQVFGFDPSTPRDEISGSIPQALMLMNGQQINQAISGTRRNTDLARLLATTSDNDDVATELYLRCLGREPNKAELQTCLTYVKRSQNRATGFEDILWALVNSTEFLHRK